MAALLFRDKIIHSAFFLFSFILLAYLASITGIIFANAFSMKKNIIFLALLIFLTACSSPKKSASAEKTTTHAVTKKDMMKGGTSFENAVVIKVKNESEGVAEEYRWLKQSYPGYSMIRKTQAAKDNRHYDIITFRTRAGAEKDAYFDITSFFRK